MRAVGTQLMIEQFWFGGDVRSLAGPLHGEGGGIANGERFGYRVSLARPTDEGARMRLTIEPAALPYNAEIDGLLTSGNDRDALRWRGYGRAARRCAIR